MTNDQYLDLLRMDFVGFIHRSFTELNPEATYLSSRYIELIASKLEGCRRGKIKRLIISAPPRCLKSHIASVAFVAWLLAHDPTKKIICASYGQDLSDKLARDCWTLMAADFFRELYPETKLAGKQSVREFMTSKNGFRFSTSVQGGVTGRGADFIILDDVMKPIDALSDTRRNNDNNWYQNSVLSRLNSKEHGCVIIVMQRLHEDDLVGHVLEQEDTWEVLSLPAIAEVDEFYRFTTPWGRDSFFSRKAGEALHPERDSVAALMRVKREIGEFFFASQYQQSPRPLDGGVIKKSWFQYFELDEARTYDLKIQSWDTAHKVGELNDYSVCTTWGVFGDKYYLLDVFRMRLNYPDLKRAVRQQFERHRPSKVLIEDKSSGISLIQELKAEGLYNIEAYKIEPGSDKNLRLHAVSIKFENGQVFVPFGAAWLPEYLREVTGFPGAKYDDQVDSTTQALEYIATKGRASAIWARLGRQSRTG